MMRTVVARGVLPVPSGRGVFLVLPLILPLVATSTGRGSEAAPTPAPLAGRDCTLEVSLDETIRLGLEHSPAMAGARSEVGQAAAARVAAYGRMLPTIDASYGYLRATQAQLDPTGRAFTTSGWGAELTASYDPVASLVAFAPARAAQRAWEAAAAGLEAAAARTVLAVKEAYYQAVAARELITVESERLERQTRQLELVAAQLSRGRMTKMAQLRSEIDRNNARVALARAQADFITSAERLGVVVGLDRLLYPKASTRLAASGLSRTRRDLVALARQASPRLRTARARNAAAEAELAAARLAYVPKLVLTAGWVWQGKSFPPDEQSWRLMASGSYPLFDGLQREADVARAAAAVDAARASEREAELAVISAVGVDYDRAALELELVRLGEQTIQLAREELALQQELFRLSRGTLLELQTAQVALDQAELELVRARLRYAEAVARLESLLGGNVREAGNGA